VSLATVAGFVSLLPGGAGVREAVLIGLMQQAGFSAPSALVAAAVLRIVWLAAELAIAAAWLVILSLRASREPNSHAGEERADSDCGTDR
jgi:uncharacterized membrane protein YbhN (UPF0104 family)